MTSLLVRPKNGPRIIRQTSRSSSHRGEGGWDGAMQVGAQWPQLARWKLEILSTLVSKEVRSPRIGLGLSDRHYFSYTRT